MNTPREQLAMDTFVDLADTLSSDFDVGDFLQLLVDRCGQILEVETGGVLVEAPDGTLQLAAATSERMKELEDLELAYREGPCLDAYRGATQVLSEDLRDETERWPKVVPKAMEMGLLAVYAFPVRLREDCIGALNLYREVTGAFRDSDVRLAQAFADVAAIGILQERKVAEAEQRARQLQHALDSRVLIEQAKGIIAERYDLSPQAAFEEIRRHARSNHLMLREVCREIVEGGDPVRPTTLPHAGT